MYPTSSKILLDYFHTIDIYGEYDYGFESTSFTNVSSNTTISVGSQSLLIVYHEYDSNITISGCYGPLSFDLISGDKYKLLNDYFNLFDLCNRGDVINHFMVKYEW